MIQRIQSILLLFISVLASLLMFIPFAGISSPIGELALDLLAFKKTPSVNEMIIVPQILNVLVGALAFFTIFLFKNRKRQMVYCFLTAFAALVLFATLFFMDYAVVSNATSMLTNYKWSAFLPILQFALALLARFFIHKDEQLVKSSDRLR